MLDSLGLAAGPLAAVLLLCFGGRATAALGGRAGIAFLGCWCAFAACGLAEGVDDADSLLLEVPLAAFGAPAALSMPHCRCCFHKVFQPRCCMESSKALCGLSAKQGHDVLRLPQ